MYYFSKILNKDIVIKIFLLLVAMFLFNSCEEKPELILSNNIDIKINLPNSWANAYYHNDSLFLYHLQNKKIIFYNLLDIEDGLIIQLDSLFSRYSFKKDYYTNSHIYIHNLDSIFTLLPECNCIVLLNKKGKIINDWVIDCPLYMDNKNYVLCANKTHKILFKNGVIYTSSSRTDINMNYNDDRTLYYQTPLEVEININGNQVINDKGFFPDCYLPDLDYLDYWAARIVTGKNDLVYSFGVSHNLYQIDVDGNETIMPVRSVYLDTIQTINESNKSNIKKFKMSQGRYHNLIYDRYRSLYYRLVMLPTNFEKEDGTVNRFHDWSVIIMDGDFKILNEQKFDKDKFYPYMFYPSKKGIYIGKMTDDIFNCKTYHLSLFKIN